MILPCFVAQMEIAAAAAVPSSDFALPFGFVPADAAVAVA